MNDFKARFLSVFVLVCLLAARPDSHARAKGSILRVKWDAPGPTHNGSSWTYAYTDLQSALAASQPGTQIWVAQGIYKPTTGTDRGVSFELRNDTGVYGGFVGNETMRDQRDPVANVTILSGDIGLPGVATDNSHHVLRSKTTGSQLEYAEVDGFTVTGGNADGEDRGGGLWFSGAPDSKLELHNMIFKDNLASWDGGGVSCYCSVLLLDHVTFEDNKANRGGGLDFAGTRLDLRRVNFTGNIAYESGGGLDVSADQVILYGVTFTENKAEQFGGGLTLGNSDARLENVIFTNNAARMAGGGMFDFGSSLTMDRVNFTGNRATGDEGVGGGLYVKGNATLDGVTFKANTAKLGGGGLFNVGTVNISNSTFYANSTGIQYLGGGAGIYNAKYYVLGSPAYATLNVTNSTFYKNASSGVGGGILNRGTATVSYSTFSHNSAVQDGAGIRNSTDTPGVGGYLTLNNSILANSTAGEDCGNYGESFTGDHNLIETNDVGPYACGSPLLTSDPNLGLLRDNGGYTTTMALLPGSPAIDAADDDVCPARDQRGAGRPEGNHCDLGAYEAPPPVTVGPGIYDDMDAAWAYIGNWTVFASSPAYAGGIHYTTTVDNYAELTFTGSQFSLLYTGNTNRGTMAVYVDGALIDTIDQYTAAAAYQKSWQSGDLGAGVHTVKFVHAGPADKTVNIDAIEILP